MNKLRHTDLSLIAFVSANLSTNFTNCLIDLNKNLIFLWRTEAINIIQLINRSFHDTAQSQRSPCFIYSEAGIQLQIPASWYRLIFTWIMLKITLEFVMRSFIRRKSLKMSSRQNSNLIDCHRLLSRCE